MNILFADLDLLYLTTISLQNFHFGIKARMQDCLKNRNAKDLSHSRAKLMVLLDGKHAIKPTDNVQQSGHWTVLDKTFNCKIFIHQVAMPRRQQKDLSVNELSHHMVKASRFSSRRSIHSITDRLDIRLGGKYRPQNEHIVWKETMALSQTVYRLLTKYTYNIVSWKLLGLHKACHTPQKFVGVKARIMQLLNLNSECMDKKLQSILRYKARFYNINRNKFKIANEGQRSTRKLGVYPLYQYETSINSSSIAVSLINTRRTTQILRNTPFHSRAKRWNTEFLLFSFLQLKINYKIVVWMVLKPIESKR